MFKSLMLGLTTAALGVSALTVPVAAEAQRYGGYDNYGRYDQAYGDAYRGGWNQGPRYYDRGGYDDRGPRRCKGGTTGTIIGAIAGGLLGRAIDDRGDRALGTILGAGGGALAGRAVERSGNPGYCR